MGDEPFFTQTENDLLDQAAFHCAQMMAQTGADEKVKDIPTAVKACEAEATGVPNNKKSFVLDLNKNKMKEVNK